MAQNLHRLPHACDENQSDAQTSATHLPGDFLSSLWHHRALYSRSSRHFVAHRRRRLFLQRFTAIQPLAPAKSSRSALAEPLAKQCRAAFAQTRTAGVLVERRIHRRPIQTGAITGVAIASVPGAQAASIDAAACPGRKRPADW